MKARSGLPAHAARGLALTALGGALALGGCGGAPARAPAGPRVSLPRAFRAAFGVDASGDSTEAARAYAAVVLAASEADGDPWQVPALEAALEALVTREMPSLEGAARDAGLVWRTPGGPGLADALGRAAAHARGPFARALIARALTTMAERRGDASAAASWREATGCATRAVVVGPTSWTPVTGVDEPGPLDAAGASLQSAYPLPGAFATPLPSVPVSADGCAVPLAASSARPGVREVVVDVEVPRAQSIGVVLRAHGAAVLRAAGVPVLRRSFDRGEGDAARFARVRVSPGTLRLVARVGFAGDDGSVEIVALGEDGAPLRAAGGAPGAAGARVEGVEALPPVPRAGLDEAILGAAADLGAGDPREAERALWPVATRADAAPELGLLYARAVQSAPDLSPAIRDERARAAYERVLELWPDSWEAAIEHAALAGARRGRDEAGVETLRDLATPRSKSQAGAAQGPGDRGGAGAPPAGPEVAAFEGLIAGREHLFDRAAAALDRARPALAGTALLADAEDAATPRVGAELARAECDPARSTSRDTLACFDALRGAGDHAGALAELARLRGALGASHRFAALELREAVAIGDAAARDRALALLLPGEHTLGDLSVPRGADALDRLLEAAPRARDAAGSLASFARAAGDDPAHEFEGVAERLAAEDRAHPILPSAATAVLAHTERYDLAPTGLLHWMLHDVRRVNGTTDVDQNAQAAPPVVWGHASMRAIRRRILKRDGRVLEPDRAPRASQAHADLSQLEQGDVVEALYEGWALPGDTGDVGIDTPDLLPDRTAVHEATVELAVPAGLRSALWSHPLLGTPAERTEAGRRVLTWHVTDHPERRIEDGVPRMDRSAAVSFSTAQWPDLARALRETMAELDESDPEIGAWARQASGVAPGAPVPRAAIDALVAAAGKAVHEADAGALSDYGGGVEAVQSRTARSFLTSHVGSRSWLVLRGLRELGVPAELLVAESDPYSADPAFPPHFGRFVHPLVVARPEAPSGEGGKREEVWIDADVDGPPLPAGRISPELRGRLALATDGRIAPLPPVGADQDERDEIDVRLTLGPQGEASGTFAVVLRGRDAQELAEALFRIVGAERQRALREVVLAWLPWANVDDVQLASAEGSWQVSLRAAVSVSGYAQLQRGKTWLLPGLDALHGVWPRARVSSLAATFAARAGRESALALSSAVQYHVHRRVELPSGAALARMPGPVDVRTGLLQAARRMSVSPGQNGQAQAIEDDFSLSLATGTIPPRDYDAFVRSARTTDDGFLASTRVTLP